MIKQLSRIAAALVLAVAITVPAASPAAAYGGYDDFQTWILKGARSYSWGTKQVNGQTVNLCTVVGRVFVQEMGKQGVTVMKVSWELRSPQGTGWVPTAASTPYGYTGSFPDDATNYHYVFELAPGHLNFVEGGRYEVWVKTAGVRAFKKDFTRHFSIGEVKDCEPLGPGKLYLPGG